MEKKDKAGSVLEQRLTRSAIRICKEGSFVEMTSEYKHGSSAGVNPANVWGNCVPGKENILRWERAWWFWDGCCQSTVNKGEHAGDEIRN